MFAYLNHIVNDLNEEEFIFFDNCQSYYYSTLFYELDTSDTRVNIDCVS